ncbi:MAG TPA: biopolymer transporter ExbD [Thermoanaerobaculia bacterium]|nr:biopolymer transporter ExbD [Thermoanaerobaculia bacterium]
MELHVRKRQDAVIPTATMADIALLLIIFFLVTFQIEVDKTQVELPASGIRLEVPEKSAYVSVTEDGAIRVSSGEEVSVIVSGPQEVLSFAAELMARAPDRAVVLKADEATPYRLVDEVMDALKQARVKTIYLLSEAEMQGSGGGA